MKILCVGRNYAEHAAELNNPIPDDPMLFLKPSTAYRKSHKPLYYPDFTKDLHYEVELVLKICKNGKHVDPKFAHKYYMEVSVGIDFTARDIQQRCKENSHPWEIAKGWDGSAPVGDFIAIEEARDEEGHIPFSLRKNGELVQEGSTKDMLHNFDQLIAYSSKFFLLNVGDFFFTGTPKGVGPVQQGDVLEAYIGEQLLLTCPVK